MTPEGRITRQIVDFLELEGAYVIKYHGSAWARAGVPDLLACYRGRFVALEVKAPTGVVSERQKHEHRRIIRADGIVAVVRSVDDVRGVLR